MILYTLLTPWTLVAAVLLYYIVPFLAAPALYAIPGPLLARFTNLWLLYESRMARRSLSVHAAHQKYGTFVRIQPNHVSVADDAAIPLIYGHGNGFLKSFYDAFVSIHRGLFNVRDRAAHSRKRKIVSHTFSARSIGQFEQYMHHNLEAFVRQWDKISRGVPEKNGFAKLDALTWFNYVAFDIIGDLAFGAPFGMIESGKDIAEVRATPDSKPTFAPAIQVLNRRGEVSGTVGVLPQLKPYAKYLPDPFFSQGMKAIENLAGIAVARVSQRLDNPSAGEQRVDLLARLQEGRDESGQPLGRQELTAEALTQLIAGSDTTSNTSCAILYWCLKNPRVIEKLQQELDQAIPDGVDVPTYDMVKELPYLESVIKETMRIHSTSSMGLPREIPSPGPGATILGKHFPAGTVLSVPAYTIHHSKAVWGADADAFVPERWEAGRLTERQKAAFIPFSYGPRACVGRNVAEMELALIVSTVMRRYEFKLMQGDMTTREGFLRKPDGLDVGLRLRV